MDVVFGKYWLSQCFDAKGEHWHTYRGLQGAQSSCVYLDGVIYASGNACNLLLPKPFLIVLSVTPFEYGPNKANILSTGTWQSQRQRWASRFHSGSSLH